MKLVLDSEAKEDLRNLNESLRKEIGKLIENLKENPLPENSYVIQLPGGTEIQCLKIQEEDRNSELNHRVTYDIKDDDFIRIYGIFDRMPGYQSIKEKQSGECRKIFLN
jgi:mRNA-degrading endonuclease RelE of RelBE toxin-antitoxin system